MRQSTAQRFALNALTTVALCALGCSEPIVRENGVFVTFRVQPSVVSVGDSLRATLVITNGTPETVVLSSGSSCVAWLEALHGNARIGLGGTNFGCLAVVSRFAIPPRDSLVQTYSIVTMLNENQPPWRYVVPPPTGAYSLQATMQVDLPNQAASFVILP